MTEGKRANKSGSLLESTVISAVRCWSPSVTIGHYTDTLDTPYLKKHAPYVNIYGSKGRTEFVLGLPNKLVRIESKWQAVSGSVDEKFPFVFLNMKQVDEDEVIILVDGGGAKPTAVSWLKEQCMLHQGRPRMQVMTASAFMQWAQAGFPDLPYKLKDN